MLVDSGMGVVSLREWAPLVSERPLDVVASHTHFDYIGCYREFPCRLCHAAEADILARADRHFEVIHTPGHSPRGIALWEAETAVLISGDTVYDGPLIEGTSQKEAAQYIASMRRLLALPVRIVHGRHFPSYSGARHRKIIADWLKEKDA